MKLKDEKANTKHGAESRKGTIPEAGKEVRWSSLAPFPSLLPGPGHGGEKGGCS